MHKWQQFILNKFKKYQGPGYFQVTGRSMGKTTYTKWLNSMMNDIHTKEIFWVETARRCSLSARVRKHPQGWELGISEQDIEPIAQWCKDHNCGRRTSFDTFQFKNNKQKTMFLLRWG